MQDVRLWGTVAIDGALNLEFQNIKVSVARSILASYNNSFSGVMPLDLPAILFAGISAEDRAFINSVTTDVGLNWFWPVGQQAPQPVASVVYRNRCSLSIRLEARLQNVTPAPTPPPILWSSRLATAQRANLANGGSVGSIAAGPYGTSFQVFWFEPNTGVFPNQKVQLAVVKRDIQGDVQWQRWTPDEWGEIGTSRDAHAPQVLPLTDGGCVVFAIDSEYLPFTGNSLTMRGWRLSAGGSTVWAQAYTGNIQGAFRVALNGSQVIVLTRTRRAIETGAQIAVPAILRFSLSSGAYVGGNAYRINSVTDSIGSGRSDNLFVLPSGSIALKISRYFMLVSADGLTIARARSLLSSGQYLDGPSALLPDGGFLCRNGAYELARLAADFSPTAIYRYNNAMFTGGSFGGFGGLAMACNASGNGCFLSIGWGTEAETGSLTGTGIKSVKFTGNGSAIVGYAEINPGSNIGSFLVGVGYTDRGAAYGIDLSKDRGFVHLTGGAGSSCKVTAIGFNLAQPTGTGADSTPAVTLNTGSCDNIMGARGWAPTYTIGTAGSITSQSETITVSSVSLTAAASTLILSDPGSALVWQTAKLAA
jgi:hypothetical protein